jgi:hypothetical protein
MHSYACMYVACTYVCRICIYACKYVCACNARELKRIKAIKAALANRVHTHKLTYMHICAIRMHGFMHAYITSALGQHPYTDLKEA